MKHLMFAVLGLVGMAAIAEENAAAQPAAPADKPVVQEAAPQPKTPEEIKKAKREAARIKAWAKKAGLTVDEFKALPPAGQSLAKQAGLVGMTYKDYSALKPAERKAKRAEAKAKRAEAKAKKADTAKSEEQPAAN